MAAEGANQPGVRQTLRENRPEPRTVVERRQKFDAGVPGANRVLRDEAGLCRAKHAPSEHRPHVLAGRFLHGGVHWPAVCDWNRANFHGESLELLLVFAAGGVFSVIRARADAL